MKLRIYEPEQGPHLSPEELARRCDEHLKVLDAEHDAIAERLDTANRRAHHWPRSGKDSPAPG